MKQKLGKFDVFSIVLGAIIGWGSFVLPGTMFLKEAGIINTALGIFLGALCIIVIESNYRVMMEDHREEGGEFSYTYKNMTKVHGFIVGWFLTLAYLTMIPLNATAIPMVFQKLVGPILQFGYLYDIAGHHVYLGEILVSSLVIVLFAYLNIKGVKKTCRIQKVLILGLVVIVIGLAASLFLKVDKTIVYEHYISNYQFKLNEVLVIFSITPFAFVGFDAIPQLVREFNFSAKRASRLAILSLLMGALLYNVLNVTTGLVYGPEEASVLEWALGSAIFEQFGYIGFLLLIIAVSAAVFGGVNGFMICSSKLVGALSHYKMLPQRIGEVNRRGGLQYAVIFISIISLIAPWFGRQVISWIVDMSSLGAAIAYFYVSYIAMKKAGTFKRKVGGILGSLISIVFVLLLVLPISPAWLGKEAFIALLVWISLGFIFYRKVVF